MSEWSDQFAELQRSWVTQQQKMLSDWLGAVKASPDDSLRAQWRQAADVMEQQVSSALAAQEQSLMACVANMEKVDGASEAVSQLKTTIERWTEVQRDTWRVWFDMLRKAAPTPKTPGEAMMQSWEEMVKQTMAIQEKWLSR